MNYRDLALLVLVQQYFKNRGYFTHSTKTNTVNFCITKFNDLFNIVIPHFDKFPLITQKQVDYLLFREIIMMMLNKEHLTSKGLEKIVAIKASLNWGELAPSEKLKVLFPNIIPVARPVISRKSIIITDPQWVAGFTTGEGHFFIHTTKSNSNKIGFQVLLEFSLTQHNRDEWLMRSFENYFRCGNYNNRRGKDFGTFRCTKFTDIEDIIIPFYRKYPIFGIKLKDFSDWCRVAEIMKNKGHTIKEGFDQEYKKNYFIN